MRARKYLVFVLLLTLGTGAARGQGSISFQGPKPFVELPADKTPPPTGAAVPDTCLPPAAVNPWCGAVELGINGAEGNSQNFNLRVGGALRRKTEDNILSIDLLYTLAELNDIRTQNRLFTLARDEWYTHGTAWGYFADTSAEYDQFKAFDLRLAMHGGVTYRFLDTKTTLLKARAGAGVSREFGGPNDDWTPELIFGGDLEHRISETTKVFATVDVFPSVTDLSDYRVQLAAGLETMLSTEYNLALKLGVQDFYDSTPEGRKANDLLYFVTLLWKF